jgi:hypothetical protein
VKGFPKMSKTSKLDFLGIRRGVDIRFAGCEKFLIFLKILVIPFYLEIPENPTNS